MGAAVISEADLTLATEDPRSQDALALIAEANAFVEALYPEDAEIGNIPTTPDELARGGLFVVARLDGRAVATGVLLPVDGAADALELKRMFVHEGMRGRRIGEHVLQRLEASAIQRGVGRVLLLTGPRQPDAIRLYERNGYRLRGPFGGHAEHPLNIFYEKVLEARG